MEDGYGEPGLVLQFGSHNQVLQSPYLCRVWCKAGPYEYPGGRKELHWPPYWTWRCCLCAVPRWLKQGSVRSGWAACSHVLLFVPLLWILWNRRGGRGWKSKVKFSLGREWGTSSPNNVPLVTWVKDSRGRRSEPWEPETQEMTLTGPAVLHHHNGAEKHQDLHFSLQQNQSVRNAMNRNDCGDQGSQICEKDQQRKI